MNSNFPSSGDDLISSWRTKWYKHHDNKKSTKADLLDFHSDDQMLILSLSYFITTVVLGIYNFAWAPFIADQPKIAKKINGSIVTLAMFFSSLKKLFMFKAFVMITFHWPLNFVKPVFGTIECLNALLHSIYLRTGRP